MKMIGGAQTIYRTDVADGFRCERGERRFWRLPTIAVILLTSSLIPVSAIAQTGPSANKATTGQENSEGDIAQEIIVTAERRATSVQTTPISVSVLSGDQLAERQVTQIQDLQTQTPGLSFTQNGFTSNINLRGLGNTTTSPNITTGVAVFHDGLYQPEAILLNTPFYDIAAVEVLRGPQGTIVGQNSTGGSLQVNSRNPELGSGINGYIEATAGNYALKRLSGAVNLPISETLAARAAFYVEGRDSFYRNLGPVVPAAGYEGISQPGRVDARHLRLSLLWRPSDAFQALLKADLNYLDTGGLTSRPRPACASCTPNSSFYGFGYDGPSALNGFRTPGTYDLVYNTPEMQQDTANRFSLDLRYTFGNGIVLRSLSGYQHLKEVRVDDLDGSAAPVGSFPQGSVAYHIIGPNNDYYSQEVNLISPSEGTLTWLAGASYFHRKTPVGLSFYPFGTLPDAAGTNASFILNSTSSQELIGLFGQVGYQITPRLQIQLGSRYSISKNSGDGSLQLAIAPGFKITLPQVGRYSDERPTWKATLNWEVNDRNFLYAFYARGFKDGGINPPGPNFQPEIVDDYEAGWKAKLLDNHILLQAGGYYMEYKAMQQQVLNPFTTAQQVTNIGNSTIYGSEISAQGRFGALSFDIGFAYNHSKLGSVSAVAAYQLPAGQLPPQCAPGQIAGCFDYAPYIVNLSGQKNPYSPEITLNASIGYKIPMGGGATLTPRIGLSHMSSQYASIFQNTNYFLIASHTQIDAFALLHAGDWDVEGFVRNLTDRHYVTGLNNAAAFYAAPRTFGVRVSRQF
jgi:iron complex outermembrane receptor protein